MPSLNCNLYVPVVGQDVGAVLVDELVVVVPGVVEVEEVGVIVLVLVLEISLVVIELVLVEVDVQLVELP